MPTCRSIPAQAWRHALQALVFYFSRRGQLANAEDLAQQTLLAMWNREDYEFNRDEDFLRVCYGFADKVLKAERRRAEKWNIAALDPNAPGPLNREGPKAAEDAVFLREVREEGQKRLTPVEWMLIEETADATLANTPYNFPPEDANRLRVRLHRVRKKLSHLTGWSGEV